MLGMSRAQILHRSVPPLRLPMQSGSFRMAMQKYWCSKDIGDDRRWRIWLCIGDKSMYLQLWRVFSLINPLIGIVLWLIFLLDRACFGSSLGLVSIFIAMVLAIGSLAVLHKRVTEKQELIAISTHLPSIMLGGLYLPPIFVIVIYKIVVLFSLLVILIPALPLGLLFFVSEQCNNFAMQQ